MKYLLFVSMIFNWNGIAHAGWEGLIQKLTQGRAELESLSKEAESTQREKQSELEQWLQRKSDADAQVQREKLRRLQISEKLKRLEFRVKGQDKSDPQAQRKLLTWIGGFESWVKSGVPFHQETRLETLKNLKNRLDKKHESMEYVLADLWSFVETEMKMAQTNEYRIMDVQIDGKAMKCEVARLGLQALFAVTPEGRVLQARKTGEIWQWVALGSAEEQNSVMLLVKNLKNKHDSGYYLLPMSTEKAEMGASI